MRARVLRWPEFKRYALFATETQMNTDKSLCSSVLSVSLW